VPLAEETEAYEVEILDGATARRCDGAADAGGLDGLTDSAAQQFAGLGALLGPGDTLDLRISAMAGRGAANLVTLQF
jgi:hypothetical protein